MTDRTEEEDLVRQMWCVGFWSVLELADPVMLVFCEKNKLGTKSDCVKAAACYAQNIFITNHKLTKINVFFALSCFCVAGYSATSV